MDNSDQNTRSPRHSCHVCCGERVSRMEERIQALEEFISRKPLPDDSLMLKPDDTQTASIQMTTTEPKASFKTQPDDVVFTTPSTRATRYENESAKTSEGVKNNNFYHFSHVSDGGHPKTRDFTEDICTDLTLEEELEGIMEVPKKDREYMRLALYEREAAQRRKLQNSAEQKRRIAESESLRLKRMAKPVSVSIKREEVNFISSQRDNQPTSGEDTDHHTARSTKNASTLSFENCHEENSAPEIINVDSCSPTNMDHIGFRFEPAPPIAPEDPLPKFSTQGCFGPQETRRCVLVQNIPRDFTVHKLLSFICGGTLVSVRLIPSDLSIGMGQSALIIFLDASAAMVCRDMARKMFSGVGSGGHPNTDQLRKMRIDLVPTATYPTREVLTFDDSGRAMRLRTLHQTRCVVIDEFPRKFVNDLCIELLLDIHHFPTRVHALEEMWFEDSALHINFTTIREATKAYQAVQYFHFGKFRTQIRFSEDPCSKPFSGNVHEWDMPCLASRGHVRLKTLIEAVGLAAYSKNHSDESDKQGAGIVKTLVDVNACRDHEATAIVGSHHSDSFFAHGQGALIEQPIRDTSWTKDLMKGLDLLGTV